MRGVALHLRFWARPRQNARSRAPLTILGAPASARNPAPIVILGAPARECADSHPTCDSGRACARMRGFALLLRFRARLRQNARSCTVFALLGARAPENAESRSICASRRACARECGIAPVVILGAPAQKCADSGSTCDSGRICARIRRSTAKLGTRTPASAKSRSDCESGCAWAPERRKEGA